MSLKEFEIDLNKKTIKELQDGIEKNKLGIKQTYLSENPKIAEWRQSLKNGIKIMKKVLTNKTNNEKRKN